MVCDAVMIGCIMLKVLFLTPTIKCSMLTIGCYIYGNVCCSYCYFCYAHSAEQNICSGLIVQLAFSPP